MELKKKIVWASNIRPFFFLALLIIPLWILRDDYDFYFIIDNGREILTNGFPHTDWATMHDGLHIVLQQWVVDVINYFLYSSFDFAGVRLFYILLIAGTFYLLYRLCLHESKNNYLVSIFVTLLGEIVITMYFGTPRPQLFTLLFVLTIIFILEKNKYLWLLPFFSLLQANFHSTFWSLGIGLMIWYGICSLIKREPNQKLFIIIPFSIITGFINPYGWEAIAQPLFTVGYAMYTNISELTQTDTWSTILLCLLPAVLITVLTSLQVKKKHNVIDLFPLIGVYVVALIGSIGCTRLLMFSVITGIILLMRVFPVVQPTQIKKPTTAIAGIALILLCFGGLYFGSTNTNYPLKANKFQSLEEVNQLMQQDSNIENKTMIATNVWEGSYLHYYNGIHPYIDGRFENFIDSVNKKEDISTRYYNAMKTDHSEYQKIIEQYNFDYILISKESASGSCLLYNLDKTKYQEIYNSDNHYNKNINYIVYKRVN